MCDQGAGAMGPAHHTCTLRHLLDPATRLPSTVAPPPSCLLVPGPTWLFPHPHLNPTPTPTQPLPTPYIHLTWLWAVPPRPAAAPAAPDHSGVFLLLLLVLLPGGGVAQLPGQQTRGVQQVTQLHPQHINQALLRFVFWEGGHEWEGDGEEKQGPGGRVEQGRGKEWHNSVHDGQMEQI